MRATLEWQALRGGCRLVFCFRGGFRLGAPSTLLNPEAETLTGFEPCPQGPNLAVARFEARRPRELCASGGEKATRHMVEWRGSCPLVGKRKNVESSPVARHGVEAGRWGPIGDKQMRKVIAGLFHSIDGVVEAPYKFQFDSFDDELGEMLTGIQEETDTVLMGRIGWSEWAGYWPTATRTGSLPPSSMVRQACRVQYALGRRSRRLVQFPPHRG